MRMPGCPADHLEENDMNGFTSIGLGQALSRGLRGRTETVRTLLAREMVSLIESDHRAWREAVGTHPADLSANKTIARLRLTMAAGRVLNPTFGG
jgi:short-subunit dehydrogenase